MSEEMAMFRDPDYNRGAVILYGGLIWLMFWGLAAYSFTIAARSGSAALWFVGAAMLFCGVMFPVGIHVMESLGVTRSQTLKLLAESVRS